MDSGLDDSTHPTSVAAVPRCRRLTMRLERCDGLARPLISLIVPCYNEQEVLPILMERLQWLARTLDAEWNCDSEILLVDDGSADGTWEQIRRFAAADHRIRGARLSRNFGQQAALTCAYALAEGDAVVCLDADLQDPPEVVPEMVERWRAGFDVVYAVRRVRLGENALKRATAGGFYWLIRKLGVAQVRAEAGEFRLMSRRSVDALLGLEETSRFIRGLVGWIGFPATELCYDRQPRAAGTTKWPLRKMMRLAADAIVAFSPAPLRLSYYASWMLSLVFLAYVAWQLVARDWSRQPSLWMGELPMVLLAVVLFGAANLLGQAILGEYVGRIHQQSLGRPLYIVQELTGAIQRQRGRPAVHAGEKSPRDAMVES